MTPPWLARMMRSTNNIVRKHFGTHAKVRTRIQKSGRIFVDVVCPNWAGPDFWSQHENGPAALRQIHTNLRWWMAKEAEIIERMRKAGAFEPH